MELRSLNKAGLKNYIESNDFGQGEAIPISYHRALSQINNPRLNPNDALLILAEEKGELLGYLGILPNLLFVPSKPILKVGWLSCIWVSAKGRGKGISNKLISEAHFKWNGNIMLTEYVPSIKRMYDSTGFFVKEPLVKRGIRLYLKADFQTILPPKKAIFEKNKSALKLVDSSLNSILSIRQKKLNFPLNDLVIEEVNEVDEEIELLIIEKNKKGYFQRKGKDLNWIFQFPWVLSVIEDDATHKKYYFTSTDQLFENKLIKLKNKNGELISFFFFTNRNGSVKLPFYYSNSNTKDSISAINHLLRKWNAKTFTTYHPKLVSALSASKTPAFHKKEINRNYLIDKQLSKLITHINLFVQDGDGDCAFT